MDPVSSWLALSWLAKVITDKPKDRLVTISQDEFDEIAHVTSENPEVSPDASEQNEALRRLRLS